MKALLALAAAVAPLANRSTGAEEIADLHLKLTFPPEFAELHAEAELEEGEKGVWRGKLGESSLSIWLSDWSKGGWQEPMGMSERLADVFRDDEDGKARDYAFDEMKPMPGPYGALAYAGFARHVTQAKDGTHAEREDFFLAGVVDGGAYMPEVAVVPPPDAAEREVVLDFFAKGVAYSGALRDPKWTDGECEERWKDSVPDADEKSRRLETIIRTEHYLILTNSSGGKLFAKKMEEFYATIRKVYPFEEVAGQRLMPVFLFQMADEYYDFYAKQFESNLEEARKSKGVASGDFYATWYEAPNDPVHIHEATHQIFGNRLYLNGGGSWFQEGVAEYVETKKNDRNEIARIVERGEHTPLPEFVRIRSLLWNEDDAKADKSGRSRAAEHYQLAGLLIEFLRESKFAEERFQRWLHAIGRLAPNDARAIERVTREIYGVDLAGLEKELAAYCAKR